MANTLDEKNLMEKYKYAGVAGQFLQAKDIKGAAKSLEKLALDIGVPVDAKPLMQGTFEDPRYMKQAIDIYQKDRDEAFGRETINSLFKLYEPFLDQSLNKEEKDNAKAEFAKFGNEKYDTIKRVVEAALEKINSKTDNFTDEQKKEAEKIYEKYSKVYETIQDYELQKMQRLAGPVLEESIGERVKDRFKKEEKSSE